MQLALPLTEIDPVGPWCQRWTDRNQSWTRRRDGGFDASRYRVEELTEAAAKAYIVRHHYSGTYPAAVARYALLRDDDISDDPTVGVIVFGVPTSARVLTNTFPDLEPYRESIELSRLVLEGPRPDGTERAPANSESWFIARAFEAMATKGYRGVVTFADPVPRRRSDGTVVMPGHVGTIYQATNATYLGRGTPRSLIMLPDGSTLNDRTVQKIRAQERGHIYAEQRLVSLGAQPPHAGDDMARWLTDALDDIGASRVRHRGNHKFCMVLGGRSARRRTTITGNGGRYPKQPD